MLKISVDDDHINHIFFINEDEINRGKKDTGEDPQNIFKAGFSGMSTYILDENNEPVPESSFVKYCEFMHVSSKRQLGYDEINSFVISTVFLGFNHGMRNDVPILFETMVFAKNGIESFKHRYTSYNAAMTGHIEAVKRARLGSE